MATGEKDGDWEAELRREGEAGLLRMRLTRRLPQLIAFILVVSCVIGFIVSMIAEISFFQLLVAFFGFFLASQIATFVGWIEKFRWENTNTRLIAKDTVTYLAFAVGYAYGTANGDEPDIGKSLLLFSLPFLFVLALELIGHRPPDPPLKN